MATGKTYFQRPSYGRFLPSDRDYSPMLTSDSTFELDEYDIYSPVTAISSSDFRKSVISGRLSRKSSESSTPSTSNRAAGNPISLPVNVPDWSKILRDEYRENRRRDSIDDDDVDGCDSLDGSLRVPPHEFLAGKMIGSFSVQEGVGRTLKGRDLRRLRNAIWAKTGFQD